MLSLFTLVFILSVLLLLIGIIKPKWVILWRNREMRKRNIVIKYFGLIALCSLLVYVGLLANWAMFFLLTTIVLILFLFTGFLVGMVFPTKVFLLGKNTRKRVLLQYGLLSILAFSMLLVVASTMPSKEVDDRIFGTTYTGEYKDKLKHGEGKVFNNSSYYKGQWENDQRSGHGIEYQNFGLFKMKYDGEWKNNQENGHGKMTAKVLWMETVYEGEWKDGKREGYGKFIDKGGNIYEGEWVNDAPNGTGKFTLTNGETYEGEVKDWKRHGFGKVISSSGEVREGNWIDDELEDSDSNRKQEKVVAKEKTSESTSKENENQEDEVKESSSHNTSKDSKSTDKPKYEENPEKEQALLLAVKEENDDLVEKLLKEDINPNVIDNNGMSALMLASKLNNEKIVKLLLKYEADVNYNIEGASTLMIAALYAGDDVVDELLDNEADVSMIVKEDGSSVLHAAAQRKNLDSKILKLLLKAGADPNVQNSEGETPLINVVNSSESGKEWLFNEVKDSAEVLLDQGADPNIKDNSGYNALMWAIIRNWSDVVEMMLDEGADTSIVDNEGNSVLRIATQMGREEIVEILVDHGAE